MRILAAAGLALALFSPSRAIATEEPSIAGVWDGTIGNLPVRACFNNRDLSGTFGAYYYKAHLQAIFLENLGTKRRQFVESTQTRTPMTPRWLIQRVEPATLVGSWTRGTKELPIKLRRLELREKESPCGSMLFQGPRLEGIRIISKPAVKDGVPYTRLLLDDRGHFGSDVQIETFALNEKTPAALAINTELRKPLAREPDGWLECIRMAWESGPYGEQAETLSPRMITKHWLAVMHRSGSFCGGAHPDAADIPILFERQTGKRVDVLTWFNDATIKREKLGGDAYSTEMVQPRFRTVILNGWKPDDDCGEPVRTADSWGAELTRTGFVFTPGLPHVEAGCIEGFRLPFEKALPYLTPEGRKNVAALEAEVAQKR